MTPINNVGTDRYTAMLTLRYCFQTSDLGALVGWNSVIVAMMDSKGDADLALGGKIVSDFFADEALDITRSHTREAAKPFADVIAQSIRRALASPSA